jgi:PhnB protein
MSAPSKPGGYTSLSPYLVVHGAQRVIDFLKQTFGATELRRYDNPDGTIMHAEVRVDDTVVMIADGGGVWPPFPSWLHVYVPDVDATYQRALAAGGISVQEPQMREGDPDRRVASKIPVEIPGGSLPRWHDGARAQNS